MSQHGAHLAAGRVVARWPCARHSTLPHADDPESAARIPDTAAVALGQGDSVIETGVLDKVRKWRRVQVPRGRACVPPSHIQK